MTPKFSIVYSTDGVWPFLAQEAANRAKRFCNASSINMIGVNANQVLKRRFLALMEFDGPVWMMDADLWFVRPCKLPVVKGPIIIGSPNEHAPLDNIMTGKFDGLDFKVRETFNLSLVSLDMSNKLIRECVSRALILLNEFFVEKTPTHAEVFLNQAARELGIIVARLPHYLNWCGNTHISSKAIALHAAEQANKLEWLNQGVNQIYA